ncbi:uncharacterized protein TNCV_1376771 [Trichonephila clavipes]|nr:uncharacterized protein TNCV_1376771 [Trichonephila clavipes]
MERRQGHFKNELKEIMEKGQQEMQRSQEMKKDKEALKDIVEKKLDNSNGLTEGVKAWQLAAFLRGEAARVLQTLSDTQRLNLNSLYNALDLWFGQKYSKDYACLHMKTRLQKTGETLQDYASEIERLVNLAFSDYPENVREIISLQYFVDGLNNDKIQRAFNSGSQVTEFFYNCTPIKGKLRFCSLQETCEILAIDQIRTTALHPHFDCLGERFNWTILNSLSLLLSCNQQDWEKKLTFFLLAYRSAFNKTTCYFPSQMLFGHDLRLPADFLFRGAPDASLASEEYMEKLLGRMEEMHYLSRE